MPEARFRTREIALSGRLRTADDPATIGPTDLSVCNNMRPWDQYPRGIGGMAKINTSALASTGIRNGFHFRKAQPAEYHILAWTSDGKVWVNDTAAPNQGAFDGTALFTDTAGGSWGRFSNAPGGALAYANQKEACLWGGTEHRCAGFIDYPTTEQAYDYSDLITNIKTDANNLATIHAVNTPIDANTMLLLHLDNNVTDDSPVSSHTVTNTDVTFSTVVKKFGTHGAVFNGTNAKLTIPDDPDFDLSGGTWSFDCWVATDVLADQPLYYQQNSGDANDYVKIFIDRYANYKGYLTLEIKTASSVVVSVASSLISNFYHDTWHHIAVVESGNNYYLFVDGNLVGYTSNAGRAANCTGVVYIGNDASTLWLSGYMDELRVSNSARWVATFTPPSSAYGTGYSSTSYIGSIMPLDGFKITINTANGQISTMAVDEWNGTGWTPVVALSDGTTLSGKALGQSGTVTFTSTAATSQPTQVEKVYLYWYRMTVISDVDFSTPTISHVTVSIPFQKIKDIWDGDERPANSVLGYKSSVFYDFTSNVLENGYSSTGSTADAATYASLTGYTSSDYLYVGCMERLSGLIINLIDANVNIIDSVMSVSYWNGNAWVPLSISDGTANGSKTLGKSGWVTWNAQDRANESRRSNLGTSKTSSDTPGSSVSMYYYRIGFSATITNPTNIYHIAGVPVSREIHGYSFPMLHQNRTVLVCDMDGKKNTILMSAQGTANVFNGLDSYEYAIGQEEEINAAASLFLRFGSSVQDMLVLTKQSEVYLLEGNGSDSDTYRIRLLSEKIGCLAPMTMTTIPVGDLGGGVRRQLAIWESQRGIEVFDGASLMDPLLSNDIRDKFDPLSANYAGNSSNTAFYDPIYDEFHWCPVGTAEWVFSFKYKKWYQTVRGTAKYLYGGFSVLDVYGNSYVYGFDNAGYVYRLEHGTNFDGNDIVHTLKTGAIALNENKISEETVLRMVKVVQVAKTTANSMTVTHFGDTAIAGNSIGSFVPSATGKRLCSRILNAQSKGPHVHHEFQLALTTNDQVSGCEPIYIVAYYDGERQDVR